jgi:DNA replication protein DnaC
MPSSTGSFARSVKIDLEELADAMVDGRHKEQMKLLVRVPLLIIDDLGMRKLPLIGADELLEISMRRYERASTLITSKKPVKDWATT